MWNLLHLSPVDPKRPPAGQGDGDHSGGATRAPHRAGRGSVSDVSVGWIDLHSHVVAGVDDGAPDRDASADSLRRMRGAGASRVVATPHLRGSLTETPELLEARLDEVTAAWQETVDLAREHADGLELLRGHEVLLDIPEPDLSDARLRMAGTSFVLVEWPRLTIPPGTERVLAWIRQQGWRPVVAHPERYSGIGRQMDLALRWRDAGAYLQVNFGSLVGRYGAEAGNAAWKLLQTGLASYLASDFHGRRRLEIHWAEASAALEARGANDLLDTLTRINPSLLLQDREPVPAPLLGSGPALLDRLRGILTRVPSG